MKNLMSFGVMLLFALTSFAQKGTVSGVVYEILNGAEEPLMFANVAALGADGSIVAGTTTDMTGAYSFNLAAGTYKIEASSMGLSNQTKELVIAAGESKTLNFTLSEGTIDLGDVKIVVEEDKSSERVLIDMQKKETKMINVLSAATMEAAGDGTAIQAAKRVTGVSIEGGKYVYIRGLGDRYSKTTLNNMDMSGLDPDKNSLQLDIFPTSLIANMVVAKNFTADMPADFTGGIMNIETKDFPAEKLLSFSVSTSFNPQMHLNDQYLTYEGGATDFLGFDDGSRALPVGARNPDLPVPFLASDEDVTNFTQRFTPVLGATQEMSLLDLSLSFSMGNQFEVGKEEDRLTKNPKIGYIFTASYKSDYQFYDDVEYGEYQQHADSSRFELVQANTQTGSMGERNVLLGGLAGVAYKTNDARLKLNIMHLQSGNSQAGQFDIFNNPEGIGQSGFYGKTDNLSYTQRSLTNVLLNGTHKFDERNFELDWRIAPTITNADDPDMRRTAYTIEGVGTDSPDTTFNAGQAGYPSRIWRYLDEISVPARVDVTKTYEFKGEEAKFKFGASHIYKQRDYEILLYNMALLDPGIQSWDNTDPNNILNGDNIYPATPNGVYYQSGNSLPNSNAYSSNINNTGLYVSNELNVTRRLQAIVGVRAEKFEQKHTGRDQTYASGNTEQGNNLVNETVLDTIDIFPSLNLIYSTNEDQKIRGAYSRTIARPSFKELSFAQIIDPLTNRIFNGSLFPYSGENGWDGNLTETRIDNFDFRWENYFERGQMVSASVFYKRFDAPIELVRIPEATTSTEYQPRNVGLGQVFGIELEFKNDFSFISEKLSGLKFNGNVTFVRSMVEMAAAEKAQRELFKREGQVIEDTREMAGQSPYVINGGLTYSHIDLGLDVAAFYNVKGPTLFIVGGGLFPDLYQDPFHSLNLNFSKKLGEEGRTKIDLGVGNVLNDNDYIYYEAIYGENQPFSVFSLGRTFSLGFKHKF